MDDHQLALDVDIGIGIDRLTVDLPAVPDVDDLLRTGHGTGQRTQHEVIAESQPFAIDLDVRRVGVGLYLAHDVALVERAFVAQRLQASALQPLRNVVRGHVIARRIRVPALELVGRQVVEILLELFGCDLVGGRPNGGRNFGLLRERRRRSQKDGESQQQNRHGALMIHAKIVSAALPAHYS